MVNFYLRISVIFSRLAEQAAFGWDDAEGVYIGRVARFLQSISDRAYGKACRSFID